MHGVIEIAGELLIIAAYITPCRFAW